jgi:hypothetical protein
LLGSNRSLRDSSPASRCCWQTTRRCQNLTSSSLRCADQRGSVRVSTLAESRAYAPLQRLCRRGGVSPAFHAHVSRWCLGRPGCLLLGPRRGTRGRCCGEQTTNRYRSGPYLIALERLLECAIGYVATRVFRGTSAQPSLPVITSADFGGFPKIEEGPSHDLEPGHPLAIA